MAPSDVPKAQDELGHRPGGAGRLGTDPAVLVKLALSSPDLTANAARAMPRSIPVTPDETSTRS